LRGVLVAFSLTSGMFTPEVGAVFMFLVVGIFGSLGTVAVYFLLHDPDEEEDSVVMKSQNTVFKVKASVEGSNRTRMGFLL
jgi:hypothetical protein